ncbi:proteinaceous RNase P 1, chloroplastic/mitochondrial-like isoform X2 [Carica papaya]|uniref:proteinaceous RNase P 1, chloroplastic/mitochondrial-like isoform X2 n=1 Tax=Carica papaya TaxID=3649 RepID=UPI000B8CD603|nr:proteinaceous RNase P 1, chloroplastic/mitochondrial-like isoform X2 [Carica papaya]
MASFTFSTLHQQKQVFSFTLCKYPSPLNTFKFPHLSHFLSNFSPAKRTLKPKHSYLLVDRVHGGYCHARSSTTVHEVSTENMNLRPERQTTSLQSMNERTDENSLETLLSLKLEEKERVEKRFTKDKNGRRKLGFRQRREMDTGNSSLRSKGQKTVIKPLKDADSLAENGKTDKRSKESGVNQKVDKGTKNTSEKKISEKNVRKQPKKNKADSPGFKLRVELDMCSKRGDVTSAIQLYDKALKEEIKLEQYHYSVILYLCSSAAAGVVQPAKSGSISRTLNTLSLSNESYRVNAIELGESMDRSNGNASHTELNINFSNNEQLVGTDGGHFEDIDKMASSGVRFENLGNNCKEEENLIQFPNGSMKPNSQLWGKMGIGDHSNQKHMSGITQDHEILVTEDIKKYALHRGFEIYKKMRLDGVPMNEAILTAVARMAVSTGNGDMAFDMVKLMESLGITPRLRSYSPALSAFCTSGDIDKAFAVEKHMLAHGIHPEEHEIEALLKLSVEAGKGDKVYYLLHKLRTTVRKVLPSTADIIVKWFESEVASRVGKKKWDARLIKEAIENGGGGWHGQGWLGEGKWVVSRTVIGRDAFCKCCGEKLAMIDLDPLETENFAQSVASIARKREKNRSFQKFQKWLDYYGPYEAVIDAANVGLFSQKKFKPSKVNAIVNGMRQMLPSRKWPLIVLHNKRITGPKMNEPANKTLFDKWKNADALYATPTGSNDDWYWLYAAIKFKCLIVTNDEMRDHTFQLLGNDFFPRWKERHQVHFSFSDAGPVFHMPPPYSVVIQESEKGHWHIPIAAEHDYEAERIWLCIARSQSGKMRQTLPAAHQDLQSLERHLGPSTPTDFNIKSNRSSASMAENGSKETREMYQNLKNILTGPMISNNCSVLSELEAAEKIGDCVIDFQI